MVFLLVVGVVGFLIGLVWWWTDKQIRQYEAYRKANPPLTLVFKDRAHHARFQAFIDTLGDDDHESPGV